eukprot:CAMPEP_0175059886 /NCGR_PEP_ID=MMETSP0052_2-20121109/12684_1 /TAXON_ID=51329 ORGANISM="Polytomella parva, Strain SAG 63-3" /NCGR_SAMPLE_ID=MMETSP0052_2 /ASSEMBLY_ACC=CAM_ASM_000194 /LENGTH=170 /DNA_ID=CAMNT_0016325491 /DNA_START=49 /DNA_END=557 /DNA_ORIENTATION=-
MAHTPTMASSSRSRHPSKRRRLIDCTSTESTSSSSSSSSSSSLFPSKSLLHGSSAEVTCSLAHPSSMAKYPDTLNPLPDLLESHHHQLSMRLKVESAAAVELESLTAKLKDGIASLASNRMALEVVAGRRAEDLLILAGGEKDGQDLLDGVKASEGHRARHLLAIRSPPP